MGSCVRQVRSVFVKCGLWRAVEATGNSNFGNAGEYGLQCFYGILQHECEAITNNFII